MRGYLTTDGNYNGHTARTASSDALKIFKTNGAVRGNKTQGAGAFGIANNSIPGSRAQFSEQAYCLPDRFERLAYIVSQDDVSSWAAADQGQYVGGEQGEQYSCKETDSKELYNAATKTTQTSQSAKDNKKVDDEEALLAEEEAKKKEKEKKGVNIWGIDTEQMDSILESMKKARDRYNKLKKDSAKKSLNYEHQRISGTIARAKSISQAGNAVLKAKSALVSIRRKNATGNYDSNEVTIATNHARKMVRIAKRKLAHIKQEELEDKRQLKSEIEKRNKKNRKNAHRRDENMKLMAADLAYVKHKIENMKKTSNASREGSTGGSSMSPMEAMQVGHTEQRERIKETLEWVLDKNGETETGSGSAASGGIVVGASEAASIVASGGSVPSSVFSMKV